MMGRDEPPQDELFMYGVNLENRVRKDHFLRRVKEHIDFDFIYKEVEEKYGMNGYVSIPPPVILKLMLLLVLYNVRSERELMETLPERLDWLWFLGYTLISSVPDHSILSKARKRWGGVSRSGIPHLYDPEHPDLAQSWEEENKGDSSPILREDDETKDDPSS